MHSRLRFISLFFCMVLLVAMLPLATPVHAQEFTVNSTNDPGNGTCDAAECTLREALTAAQSGDTINITATGTVQLNTALPRLDQGGLTIAGPTDGQGRPALVLNGTLVSGFGLNVVSSNNTIRNLAFVGFLGAESSNGGSAIRVGYNDTAPAAVSGNQIYNCYLGTTDGANLPTTQNDFYGLLLDAGAQNTTVGSQSQPNVISGNRRAGVYIGDTTNAQALAISNNVISYNYIGTNRDATAAISTSDNSFIAGVVVENRAQNTTIGPGNWISGNKGGDLARGAGVQVLSTETSASDRRATDTVIKGNYIGLGRDGSSFKALPNLIGVAIRGVFGPVNTVVGGPTAADRNYIAGNEQIFVDGRNSSTLPSGLGIWYSSTGPAPGSVIRNNYIGWDPLGNPLGNDSDGILMQQNGSAISGFASAAILDNVIGANGGDGIDILSSNDIVQGNIISVDPDGLGLSLASINGRYSINLRGGSGHQIGGSAAGERNVISIGGDRVGIGVVADTTNNTAASNVTIEGNYVGVGSDGRTPLWNVPPEGGTGIVIEGSSGNTVRRNVVSNNYYGMRLGEDGTGKNADNNIIEGNFVGTDASGLLLGANAVPNSLTGILVRHGSGNEFRNNIVANNGRIAGNIDFLAAGIYFDGSDTSNNLLASNRIFNNFSTLAQPRAVSGVILSGSSSSNRPDQIRITQTETGGNGAANGRGIQVDPGANNGINTPSNIVLADGTPPTALVSTDCAGCTVEVFSGINNEVNLNNVNSEGPVYLGSGTTDGSGNATVSIDGCGNFVTATVTDASGNTSEFSQAFPDSGNVCSLPDFSLTGPSPASPQEVTAGNSIVYEFTLLNTDGAERTFDISRSSSQGWAGLPIPTSVTLAGGESQTISVEVTVPPGAPLTASDTTTLLVRTGLVEKSLDAVTTVREATGPQASISGNQSEEISSAGGQITFEHTVTNVGDTAGAFAIAAAPDATNGMPVDWIGTPTLDDANLDPGASTTARLVVTVPSGVAADTIARVRLTVTAGTSSASAVDTVTVTFAPGLEFTPETTQTRSSAPGVTLDFSYTLTNTGNGTDSYVIKPQPGGFPAGWSVNTINLTDVAAGASEQVTVRVTIPAGADEATGQSVAIEASSVADPGLVEVRDISITVLGAAAPLINPDPAPPAPVDVRSSIQTITFTHVVSNTGNKAAPFAIDVPTFPSGWSAPTVLNNTCGISITKGDACSFALAVTVPQDADARDYTVTVQATAQDSEATRTTLDNTVTVQAFPDLDIGITPDAASGDPGSELIYTITVTNTGNGADSYDLAQSISGPTGWTAAITPTQLTDLPRDGSTTATLAVGVPQGVDATTGTANVTVVGTSLLSATVQATAIVIADINEIPGAAISPGTTKNANPGDTEPEIVTYNHTVTNTGSIPLTYTIALSNSLEAAGWTAGAEPASFALVPGATQDIVVSVTAPAGAEGDPNETVVRVLDGSTELASAVNITQVGPIFGAFLEPNVNAGVILPGATRVYTHTLRNTGSSADTYTFETVAALGWQTAVMPSFTTLGPGESTIISVEVTAPTSVISGSVDYARVQVLSENNPDLVQDPRAQAEEQTTVLQTVGVDVSPRPFVRVTPESGEVTLEMFAIKNLGNGVDTFDVRVRNDKGWSTSFALPSGEIFTTIARGGSSQLRVKTVVPPDIRLGEFSIVTIEVVSRSDPTKLATTQAILVYPDTRTFVPDPPVPGETFRTYLPIVRRAF